MKIIISFANISNFINKHTRQADNINSISFYFDLLTLIRWFISTVFKKSRWFVKFILQFQNFNDFIDVEALWKIDNKFHLFIVLNLKYLIAYKWNCTMLFYQLYHEILLIYKSFERICINEQSKITIFFTKLRRIVRCFSKNA